MAIEGVDVPTMKAAIRAYLGIAWGDQAEAHWPAIDFEKSQKPEDVLEGFTHDATAGRMRRYTLRLGNRRYPFMKLVFQELLIRGRFFFSVDTHDELGLREQVPDYDEWLALKRFNADLKAAVEKAWLEQGVPTFATIVAQVEKETPPPESAPSETAPLILIVDDDAGIARGVDTILRCRGYRTLTAGSAEEALDVLKTVRPSLILSDLEMPGMSGLDLAAKVRKSPKLKGTPFILATAASVDHVHFQVIDGFLVKPYESPVLLKFVSEHLSRDEDKGPGSET